MNVGKFGWEMLGFGLMVGGPVAGAVILANKSPGTSSSVWSVIGRMVPASD